MHGRVQWISRIPENANARRCGDELLEKCQALAGQLEVVVRCSRAKDATRADGLPSMSPIGDGSQSVTLARFHCGQSHRRELPCPTSRCCERKLAQRFRRPVCRPASAIARTIALNDTLVSQQTIMRFR